MRRLLPRGADWNTNSEPVTDYLAPPMSVITDAGGANP